MTLTQITSTSQFVDGKDYFITQPDSPANYWWVVRVVKDKGRPQTWHYIVLYNYSLPYHETDPALYYLAEIPSEWLKPVLYGGSCRIYELPPEEEMMLLVL